MEKIKNVVFDLGGVLVDLDLNRCIAAFRTLGMDAVAELINPYYPAEMIGRLEHGDITFHEACEEMRRLSGTPDVPDERIAWAYGEFLVTIPVTKLRQIEALRRRGIRTYVLSNNNPASMEFVRRMFTADGHDMEYYFDAVYLSYRMHELKPSEAIFRKMIAASGLEPAETLFIDDGRKNVDAAQALGFAESDPSFDIEGYDSLFKLVIITVHALGTYVAPERIFTYGISTIHDSDIQYAREKNVKIKLVAQVVKVSDEHFTMFVMPEFVTPAKYIYSVDDEYNGVVIRGECYDRQFMFGKGAGSLPTASSILSDIMARLNNYRYEYKKMNYIEKPDYTTDITLKIYARYKETDVQGILNFSKIHEQFISEESNYVIGEIPLRELLEKRSQLSGRDVFLANIPIFFLNRD